MSILLELKSKYKDLTGEELTSGKQSKKESRKSTKGKEPPKEEPTQEQITQVSHASFVITLLFENESLKCWIIFWVLKVCQVTEVTFCENNYMINEKAISLNLAERFKRSWQNDLDQILILALLTVKIMVSFEVACRVDKRNR